MVTDDRMADLRLHLDGTWEQTCVCRQAFTAATATQVAAKFDEHECAHLTVAAFLVADSSLLPTPGADGAR